MSGAAARGAAGVPHPQALPRELHTVAQARALDAQAIASGTSGEELMERAGTAVFATIGHCYPAARRLVVVCGTGNNGGDGWVVARRARAAGLEVQTVLVGERERIRGDAARALGRWDGAAPHRPRDLPGLFERTDVVVDALYGIGLNRAPSGAAAGAIADMNAAGLPVVAVDVPSGIDADTGARPGAAVHAALTVTFIALKRGLLTGAAPAHTGRVLFDGLGLPAVLYEGVDAAARRIDLDWCSRWLGPRARSAHKGDFGHVLVVGGERGFAGAARLAAEAAARSGAGLVSVATRAAHAGSLCVARPELMCHGVEDPDELKPLLARASVVALGPGLGTGAWGEGLAGAVLRGIAGSGRAKLVVDADALNLVAARRVPAPAPTVEPVFTPHPGEAGRLLGSDARAVQTDRFAALAALRGAYGGVWILKGAGTLIGDASDRVWVCTDGNPGMASGGMGDVLGGLIAGLLAQGLDAGRAALLGVSTHARAGDLAADADGERGLLAGDLLALVRRLLNGR